MLRTFTNNIEPKTPPNPPSLRVLHSTIHLTRIMETTTLLLSSHPWTTRMRTIRIAINNNNIIMATMKSITWAWNWLLRTVTYRRMVWLALCLLPRHPPLSMSNLVAVLPTIWTSLNPLSFFSTVIPVCHQDNQLRPIATLNNLHLDSVYRYYEGKAAMLVSA